MMIKLLITLCFMYDLSTRLFNFAHQTMKYISTNRLVSFLSDIMESYPRTYLGPTNENFLQNGEQSKKPLPSFQPTLRGRENIHSLCQCCYIYIYKIITSYSTLYCFTNFQQNCTMSTRVKEIYHDTMMMMFNST